MNDPCSSPLRLRRQRPWPRRFHLGALTAIAAAIVAACGGDGDSTTSSPPSGPVTVSGTATFDSVPFKSTGVGLDYGATTQKPIRGATVQLLDASNNVIGTTTTSDTGTYSFTLASAQAVVVRVRAEIRRTGSASGDRDVTVRDNTAGGGLYVLDSAAFTPAATATTQDLRAGSGWGGSGYTAARSAAPFAILDVVYTAQAKIATAAPAVNLPTLRIFWSPNNRPVGPYDESTGAIETSFFTPLTDGTRGLFLLGAADTDSDEYDSHVVAHEFGHYMQDALSRSDSMGGSHMHEDKLDMRLAFGEGWGNAWAGMALANPIYSDSQRANQGSGFSFDLRTPGAGADRGWYSETSAQYLLYAAHQDGTIGFAPIYAALRGMTTTPTFTTLYSFAEQLKAAAPAAAAAVTSLWASQLIVANDAYGTGETNTGGVATHLPVYNDYGASANVTRNYCVNTAADPDNDGNKLGRFVYVRFTLSGARTITVTRNGGSFAAASDPDLYLVKADGSRVSAYAEDTPTQALATTLPAGTHVVGFNDVNLAPGSSGPATSCFNFTVN